MIMYRQKNYIPNISDSRTNMTNSKNHIRRRLFRLTANCREAKKNLLRKMKIVKIGSAN